MTTRRPVAILVAGALALLAALAAGTTTLLERAERETVDARFAVRGAQPVDDLAVVAIDEATLSARGMTWPLRRSLHARVLDRLRAAGAGQVVYDVQFTEPSGRPADDDALVRAIRRTRGVVLATAESDDRGRTRVLGGERALRWARAEAAASSFPTDDGGVIRRYEPSVARLDTLATATARRLGAPPAAFDADGTALIDFRGPGGTIPTYAFGDVLRGRVPAGDLRGRTVVVGATAASLRDVHPTSAPGGRLMPGPEIQANAIWTAVHGNPLRRLTGVTLLLTVGLGLLGPLLVLRLDPLRATAAGLAVAAAYGALAQLAFHRGTVVPVAEPLAALGLTLAAAVLAGVGVEIANRRRIARYNAELERAVQGRTAELAASQLEVARRLAWAAELRDDDTGDHVERMSELCGAVALELGLPVAEADLIRQAAVLHDVGKIGVPDGILRKPGRLTPEETAVMRRHVAEGVRLLGGSDSPLLQLAETIARTHHERWDGTGYPAGIPGADIPLAGRIAGACDVYDALISVRPYKPAWSVEEACAEIERGSGSHFDPIVAAALIEVVRRRTADATAVTPDAPVAV